MYIVDLLVDIEYHCALIRTAVAQQFANTLFQVKQMGAKDLRLKMMNEILNGIKVTTVGLTV